MKNLTILLVESNHDLAESLQDYLELKNHNVDIVGTANECFAAIAEKFYDAIIMDFGLPDINGFSAYHYIKEAEPDSRIMLMTGFSRFALDQDFNFTDTLPVMTKPLDLDALMIWLDTP